MDALPRVGRPDGALVPPAGRQGPGPVPGALVAALDLRLVRRAAGPLPGERLAPGVGVGTELAQLRPYQPGDDVRYLDPAASARTGVAHVRQHVPERALTTWLVVDISASMAFGTATRLKSDVAEGVALVLARLAVRRGGRVALLTFGAPVARVLPPRSGRGAPAQVARALAEGVAADVAAADPLVHALRRLRRVARHPGLVVVVSDFRDAADWSPELRAVAVRHRAVAVEITDPREHELPDVGILVAVDPETGCLAEADTGARRVREAYAAAERARRQALAAALRRANAEHVELSTGGDWLRILGRALR
jgi:uncharacterized protein (DUF58 family)